MEDSIIEQAIKNIKNDSNYRTLILSHIDEIIGDNAPLSRLEDIFSAIKQEREIEIHNLLDEKERIESLIEKKHEELRKELTNTFSIIETHLQAKPSSVKEKFCDELATIKLSSIESLGILKETADVAFITALEKKSNLDITINTIAKNLTTEALDSKEFSPEHIANIVTTILQSAFNLAEASPNDAKEIVKGATLGVKEGVTQTIKRFERSLEFMPLEIQNSLFGNTHDLIGFLNEIDTFYLDELSALSLKSERVVSYEIESVKKELSSPINRLTIESKEAVEKIKKRIELIQIHIPTKESLTKATSEAKKLGLKAWQIASATIDGALKGAKSAMDETKEKK